MRIDKFLCDLNIGTRSEVKKILSKGLITVDGVLIKKADFQVNPESSVITYQGKELYYKEFYYYLLYKPAGYITATEDSRQATVMELLNALSCKNLSPVGRLDKDTEGVLLLTNDGVLNHRLLSPKYHVDKTYEVHLAHDISPQDVELLERGVDIGDETLTEEASVTILQPNILQLTIHEGRFHQVKRMMEAVGNEVTYLKRISFGTLSLEGLQKGEYRELSENEVHILKQQGSK